MTEVKSEIVNIPVPSLHMLFEGLEDGPDVPCTVFFGDAQVASDLGPLCPATTIDAVSACETFVLDTFPVYAVVDEAVEVR
jgi:hypothetical protein